MQINPTADSNTLNIGVVGGGSWGTALANLLAHKGYTITLWVYPRFRTQKRNINHIKQLQDKFLRLHSLSSPYFH
jgi:glycerol-3-phosphate dehydrogenase